MTSMTLPELSKRMQKIDFCMMCTLAPTGAISTRPMSNNGDVDYDGDTGCFPTGTPARCRTSLAIPG